MADNPNIFIGSSVEALPIARAIQEELENDAFCTVWNQGIFELSKTSLESLINAAQSHDFATFVLSPDDLAKIRGEEFKVARDNLIFEMGLFIGLLSKDKVFYLIPKNEKLLHLPTDLLGIQPGEYLPPENEEKLRSALGPFCNKIRKGIKKYQECNKLIKSNSSDVVKKEENANLCELIKIEEGVFKKEDGKYLIDIQSTVFFHYRICSAFPGEFDIKWFEDPENALDRLEILLKSPVSFHESKKYGASNRPIWWFKPPCSSSAIVSFERINKTKCLINNDELDIEKIAVFRSRAYWQDFVYVQSRAEEQIGLHGYSKEEIDRRIQENGYADEEYALFKEQVITMGCFNDGAAEIGGKVLDVDGAVPRRRFLSPYNLLLAAQLSPINSSAFEEKTKNIFNHVINNPQRLYKIKDILEKLPKKEPREIRSMP